MIDYMFGQHWELGTFFAGDIKKAHDCLLFSHKQAKLLCNTEYLFFEQELGSVTLKHDTKAWSVNSVQRCNN